MKLLIITGVLLLLSFKIFSQNIIPPIPPSNVVLTSDTALKVIRDLLRYRDLQKQVVRMQNSEDQYISWLADKDKQLGDIHQINGRLELLNENKDAEILGLQGTITSLQKTINKINRTSRLKNVIGIAGAVIAGFIIIKK